MSDDYSWLGRLTTHKVIKTEPKGFHLHTPEGPAFLPAEEVESAPEEGDEIEAFIYHNYDGFLTATTQKPLIQVGEFAYIRVKAAGDKGAFADWGLAKDIFIPHAEQLQPVEKGKSYVMYAYVDEQTGRIAATTRVDRIARDTVSEEERSNVPSEGSQVPLLISRRTDLGYKAIILQDPPLSGTLYKNEVFQDVEPGSQVQGYIKQLRDDGKIDLSLRRPGYDEVLAAADMLMEKMDETESGFLPYHDKSDAGAIRDAFGISKRTFKAAVGALLKEGRIDIELDGIRKTGRE